MAATAEESSSSVTSAPTGESDFFRKGDNSRGIPEAIFLENVEGMCTTKNVQPTELVTKLQELYGKYQYMQSSLVAQRASLKTKLPDIASALASVRHLITKRDKAEDDPQDTEYTYQLSENLWARAAVPPSNVVCLWLGASVMLEYTLDEAVELLTTNEANARETLKNLEEDMAFLRDQLTTTEVNIARTHNYGVKLRQASKEAEADKQVSAKPLVSAGTPGGAGEGYTWKQDATEVEISVDMPEGTKKVDVEVKIVAESIQVKHAGKIVVEGELAGRCSPGGSTWTMNSGRAEISLEKAEQKPWTALFA